MIEIKLIDNPQDLQRVFRLRYAVYVEELGAEMAHADHQRREVREPWDKSGDNLGAWINGELVGGVRINYGGASDLTEYQNLFNPVNTRLARWKASRSLPNSSCMRGSAEQVSA